MSEKTYILRPKSKKSLVERVTYIKDGTVFSYTEGYTGGEWVYIGNPAEFNDHLPPLDDDSIDMNMYYEWEFVQSGQGHTNDWEFIGPADAELVEEAEEVLDNEGHWGLEEAGWTYEDTEWLVYNGLVLTEEKKDGEEN